MPLPDFPLEIWLNVFERACQDNGTTGVSLSATSRELRLFSKPYRYQSVQIKGWKQLLLFEERFSQLTKDDQGIVNLFVGLENVFEAGYPNAPDWAPEDEPDSSSYVPSDDESNSSVELGDVAGSDTEDESAEGDDLEYELEFTSPSPSEQLELEQDCNYFLHPGETSPQSRFNTVKYLYETLEDLQADSNSESCQAEGYAYAVLHRVFKACTDTLEMLTLFWRPLNGFKAEALFPVLPRLRSLVVWRNQDVSVPEGIEFHRTYDHWWSGDIYQIPKQTILFPVLKRLDYNRIFDVLWFKFMSRAELPLEYVSVPCKEFECVISFNAVSSFLTFLASASFNYPQTIKRLRICCDCPNESCSEGAAAPPSLRVNSVDVKKEWVDQVLQCSPTPGFVEGRMPVVLVVWTQKVTWHT